MNPHRANLLSIYQAALKAVHGRACTRDYLQQHPQAGPCRIIAIGKAAAAMAVGALDVLDADVDAQAERLLLITRHGYTDPVLAKDSRVQQLEAGHPLPDQASLDAGQALLGFIAASPASTPLLFLISGGTSALVEVLPVGITLAELQRVNAWLLASGLPIEAMNAVRTALSLIKGGGLRGQVQGLQVQALLMSDVPNDEPAIIGSGLLCPPVNPRLEGIDHAPDWLNGLLRRVAIERPSVTPLISPDIPHHIIASADDARHAAVKQAQRLGYGQAGSRIYEHEERVVGDVHDAAQRLAAVMADHGPGLHLWSGETTVVLPDRPGQGGRCQSLALAFALLHDPDHQAAQPAYGDRPAWLFLAAGSDGSDGPGGVAGALVDGGTLSRMVAAQCEPRQCLAQADAGPCLQLSGDSLVTGPTGSNVMDILLGLRC